MDWYDYEYPDFDDYEEFIKEERRVAKLEEENEKHGILNGITFNGKPIIKTDW